MERLLPSSRENKWENPDNDCRSWQRAIDELLEHALENRHLIDAVYIHINAISVNYCTVFMFQLCWQ